MNRFTRSEMDMSFENRQHRTQETHLKNMNSIHFETRIETMLKLFWPKKNKSSSCENMANTQRLMSLRPALTLVKPGRTGGKFGLARREPCETVA